ncbi:hypothetical protein [Acrocarpospora sp. B8E8]|uniref:hypothetical protein n=1 Tax=Acrocarpospora sp. B8E8 TaxID=3153572 RepID=UPI00325F7186
MRETVNTPTMKISDLIRPLSGLLAILKRFFGLVEFELPKGVRIPEVLLKDMSAMHKMAWIVITIQVKKYR